MFFFVIMMPAVSLNVRRLHDIDKSGWWMLVGLIPIAGSLVLYIWVTKKGLSGPNRYGDDPLVKTVLSETTN